MAKFCDECGKKLENGNRCECKKGKPIVHNVGDKIEISNPIIQKIFEICEGIVKKPIDTIKDNIKEENFNIAVILMVIVSIIAGIFSVAFIKECYSLVSTLGILPSLYDSTSVNSLYYGNMANTAANISFASIFCTTSISVFAMLMGFSFVFYLVCSKLFESKRNFKEVCSLVACVSVVLSFSMLIGTFLMFVYIPFGIAVFSLGVILNLLYLYEGVKIIGHKDKNKHAYIYLTIFLVFYVILFALFHVFI